MRRINKTIARCYDCPYKKYNSFWSTYCCDLTGCFVKDEEIEKDAGNYDTYCKRLDNIFKEGADMKRDIEELKDYSGRMAYELNELLDIDSSLTDSDREGICSDIDIYNSYYKKLSIILRCNKCSENEEAADINCESCKLNTTKESKK